LESPAAGDSTEIVAENVLGWSFAVFLRNPQGDLTLEPPENQAFYDSLSGIEALTLQLAILPAQILPRGQITAGFADVSTRGDLFASVVADDPTGLILREHRRIFSLDVSLRSRVP
jgi:hypothetical protein